MPVLTSHVHSCDASTVGSVVSTLQLQPCLLVAMGIGIRARLITYNLINIATINCWSSLLRKKFCHIRRNRYSLWTLHVFKVLQQQPHRMVSKGRKPSWKRDCMWIFKALCTPPPRMLHKRERERERRVSPYFQESQILCSFLHSTEMFKFTPSSSTNHKVYLLLALRHHCLTGRPLLFLSRACTANGTLRPRRRTNWRFVTGYLWPSTSNRPRCHGDHLQKIPSYSRGASALIL